MVSFVARYEVDDSQMGFFAMVGPLQVFVSSHVSGLLSCTQLHHTTSKPIYDEPLHRDNRLTMLIYAGRSCSN